MRLRESLEADEHARLAVFATRARDTRGRVHPEPEHRHRTAFQRDRDRVLHARAFRRLQYKTQVFVHHEGDHFRNRLTHTLEVAQVSRSVTRTLGCNEDLVEAIVLAHELLAQEARRARQIAHDERLLPRQRAQQPTAPSGRCALDVADPHCAACERLALVPAAIHSSKLGWLGQRRSRRFDLGGASCS